MPLPARGVPLNLLDPLRGLLRRAPLALLTGALLALALAAQPSRAAYLAPGAPIRPKDFALVKKDGYYHVFYILNRAGVAASANEQALGHAMSADLYHWTQLPSVLQTDTSSWDNSHVWAPSIVYQDSLYWMLFAGTTVIPGQYNDTQRMGLAWSADLLKWNLVDHPVFSAPQVPWTWVDSLSALPAFRDPFVMPDPSAPGSWLMYYTASYGPDSLADVVGVARSSGDLGTWTDAGPLLETWRGYTYNQVTESPHLFFHGGLWYLFISTTAGQPLTFYTSANPLAPPSGWTYRGRLRNMLGTDTSNWIASEYLRDGTRDLFGYANGDRLEFREIEWGSDGDFSLVQPPYFRVRGMEWVNPTVTTADTARLAIHTANFDSGPPSLHAFVADTAGVETEVAPESLGFERSPVLASEDDTLRWQPVRWPRVPARDTVTVMFVRLRTADSTAVSGLLAVHGYAAPDTSHGSHDVTGDDPPIPNDPPIKPILRTRTCTPAGNAPAAIVQMAVPAAARVDVYDVLGRRVRNLASGDLPRGVTVLAWDGRDDSGVQQPHGIYFARLVSGGVMRSGRLLLLPR